MKVICILSMHRSGSSMVASILAKNNIPMGSSLIGKSKFNAEGHFEDRFIVSINKKILLHMDATWCDPKDLPSNWLQDPYINKLCIKAKRYADRIESRYKIFAFKDPRTCLTLPFWEEVFEDIAYIIVLREKRNVVKSILNRNRAWVSKRFLLWRVVRYFYHIYKYRGTYEKISDIDTKKACQLWQNYNANICKYTEGKDKIITRYESILQNPHREIEKIVKFVKPETVSFDYSAIQAQLNHGEAVIDYSEETRKMHSKLIK